jgi:hypothetical protein
LVNIFETRNRAMERAVAQGDPAAHGSLAPPSASGYGSANLELRPRAAASKIPPALVGISDRPAPLTTDSAAQGDPALKSDSLVPDTVRDLPPSPKLPSLPPPPVPPPVSGSKPPVVPSIPIVPKRFELPGGALFATPGAPAVEPARPCAPPVTSSPAPPQGAADGSKVNPVGPTIPAPAKVEPPSEPAQPPQPKSRIAWFSILSLVCCAFIIGIGLRRCMTRSDQNQGPSRAATTQDAGLQDASAAPATSATDAAIADAAVSDGGAALISDAGAPAAVTKPKAVRPYVRRTGPRAAASGSKSKIVKGKGKVVRGR